MIKQLLIFQHAVNKTNVYCWNGDWPLAQLPDAVPWNGSEISKRPDGKYGPEPLTKTELSLFEDLVAGRQRVFEMKGRGKFNILSRLNVEIDE